MVAGIIRRFLADLAIHRDVEIDSRKRSPAVDSARIDRSFSRADQLTSLDRPLENPWKRSIIHVAATDEETANATLELQPPNNFGTTAEFPI